MSGSLLVVGLDPDLVADAESSREAFPDVDAEVIRAGIARSRARLEQLGFAVETCFLDYGATAEDVYRTRLSTTRYDVVAIGAGVRLDPALTHLLEVLVNLTHEVSPHTTLVFNTGPDTTADAVERWYPTRRPLG